MLRMFFIGVGVLVGIVLTLIMLSIFLFAGASPVTPSLGAPPPEQVVTIITQPPTPRSGQVITTNPATCPGDFSLGASDHCTVPATGLICSGDIDEPSVNYVHDGDPTTGEILQASGGNTINGGGNGGSCHTPSGYWTPQLLARGEFNATVTTVHYYVDGHLQATYSR